MVDSPVTKGHSYATEATQFETELQYAKAIEAHSNAANEFQKAAELASDPGAKKMLTRLCDMHLRKSKEAKRKSLQETDVGRIQSSPSNSASSSPLGNSRRLDLQKKGQNIKESRSMQTKSQPLHSSSNLDSRIAKTEKPWVPKEISYLDRSIAINNVDDIFGVKSRINQGPEKEVIEFNEQTSQYSQNHQQSKDLLDFDKSFFLLNESDVGNNNELRAVDDDQMGNFWSLLDNLVQKIPMFNNTSQKEDSTQIYKDISFYRPPSSKNSQPTSPKDYFYLVNSNTSPQVESAPTSKKTFEELELENQQLKITIDYLTKRIATLEKSEEENNLLKSSIIQFRQDFRRQAMKYAISQDGGRQLKSSSNLEASTLQEKIQALEEEVKRWKEENVKQKESIARYKDRWEKLKASAKRKKEARLAPLSEGQSSESIYYHTSSGFLDDSNLQEGSANSF